MARELSDGHSEAVALSNEALIHDATGNPQRALDIYYKARTISRTFADQPEEATALNNIGSVYRELGAADRAREYYQQALGIWEKIGDDQGRSRI